MGLALGQWKLVAEELPPENKLLVIFRMKKEKYSVGHYRLLTDEEEGARWHWVMQYATCHLAEEADAWMQIPPYQVKFMKKYE